MNKEEINELTEPLEYALSGARLNLKRSTEINTLHPGCGNDLFVAIDTHNINIIQNCISLLSHLKPYPESD